MTSSTIMIITAPGVLCDGCRHRVLGLLEQERQNLNQAIARKEGEIAGIDYALAMSGEGEE